MEQNHGAFGNTKYFYLDSKALKQSFKVIPLELEFIFRVIYLFSYYVSHFAKK